MKSTKLIKKLYYDNMLNFHKRNISYTSDSPKFRISPHCHKNIAKSLKKYANTTFNGYNSKLEIIRLKNDN